MQHRFSTEDNTHSYKKDSPVISYRNMKMDRSELVATKRTKDKHSPCIKENYFKNLDETWSCRTTKEVKCILSTLT